MKGKRARGAGVLVVLVSISGLLLLPVGITAQESGTIKLGAFAPLTGPYADVGTQIKNGIELAVQHANDQGISFESKPYKIELIWGDTESKVEVGLSVVEKLLTVDKIDVGVGFLHSHIFIRVMDEFQKHKVPVVDAAAASVGINRKIAQEKMDYVFQMSPTADDIAQAVAAAVQRYMQPQKIALINENTDAGRDFAKITEEWYKTHAPQTKIVYNEFLTPGVTDFTSELAKIKAFGAEVIIGELYGAGGSAYISQWYETLVPALTAHMGATVAADDFIQQHQKQMEKAIVNNRWWPGPFTKISEPVITQYKERYGMDATNFAVQGYDAALIAIEAIKKAGSLDKAKIRDRLASEMFVTVWGQKKFTSLEEGHRVPTPMVVVQIQGGKKVPIWPEELATSLQSTFQKPPPWPWEQ